MKNPETWALRFSPERRPPDALWPIGAVLCGCGFLSGAGAPDRYLVVNGLALVAGLGTLGTLPWLANRTPGQARRFLPLLLGGTLLATALWGFSMSGISRWWRLGGLTLHAGLVVLPALIIAFARRPGRIEALGLVLALLALALQPDRAMAGAAVAGLATVTALDRRPVAVGLLGVAAMALVITLVRPDPLPAAPFVEGVVETAWHRSYGLAIFIAVGWLLMLGPAWSSRITRPVAVFGVLWAAVIVAALLGHYPMPLLGYGASAILGYCASLALSRLVGTPAVPL